MSMTYYAVTDDPNELVHWGIKGMKWGVRHDKPRHSGSRKRSAAYKKAQSKLSKAMKNGIQKAETKWKVYHSPQAKEARFMKKAMQQARNGTLKYGKLTDKQVQQVTDRLYLERNARALGSTENPRMIKRLKMAIGTGIVTGVGQGTASYINERFKGRGATTAEIKRDKRMAKYESNRDVQLRRARNKANSEYYEEAAKRGALDWRGHQRGVYSDSDRAKQKEAWEERDKLAAERAERRKSIYGTYDRTYAVKRAEYKAKQRYGDTSNNNQNNNQNNGNG